MGDMPMNFFRLWAPLTAIIIRIRNKLIGGDPHGGNEGAMLEYMFGQMWLCLCFFLSFGLFFYYPGWGAGVVLAQIMAMALAVPLEEYFKEIDLKNYRERSERILQKVHLEDEIFDTIDLHLRKAEYNKVEEILKAVKFESDVDILLAYLTASLPAKSKLPSRQLLIDRVRELVPGDNLLLQGLEQE